MSSLSLNLNWLAYKSELDYETIQFKTCRHDGYGIDPNKTKLLNDMFKIYIGMTVQHRFTDAIKVTVVNRASLFPNMTLGFTKNAITKEFVKIADENPSADITIKPWIEKIRNLYLENLPHLGDSYPISLETVKIDMFTENMLVLDKIYLALGLTKVETLTTFSNDDLESFKIKKEEVKTQIGLISCLAYALLKTREQGGKKAIFEGHKDHMVEDLPTLLVGLSYRSVENPDAGDLVCYLRDKNTLHVGIFQESGKVHSKLGILNPEVYEHKLWSIPPMGGTMPNKVIFMRKWNSGKE